MSLTKANIFALIVMLSTLMSYAMGIPAGYTPGIDLFTPDASAIPSSASNAMADPLWAEISTLANTASPSTLHHDLSLLLNGTFLDPTSNPPAGDFSLPYGVRCETSSASPEWQDVIVALASLRSNPYTCLVGYFQGNRCSESASHHTAQVGVCADVPYLMECSLMAVYGYAVYSSCIGFVAGGFRAGGLFRFDRLEVGEGSDTRLY
jgi:hypothetical protein